MKEKRWQDWLNLLIGVWLFISPWVLGFAGTEFSASWNAWILGVAIVVFSAIAVSIPQAWEEVINILLGIWMVISSWVIGVTSRAVETNAVIVGLLVILFAAWAMAMNRDWRNKAPTVS
ncbi:MAG TPA: SPW repeat protein [Casimicrobiaceae bacterium]|nr:SPW repeat protein [Casimicrobiaceae bacterium]